MTRSEKMPTDYSKHQLRENLRQRLAELDPAHREPASAAITATVLGLDSYVSAQTIFCFESRPDEPDTAAIRKDSISAGKRLLVPRMDGDTIKPIPALGSEPARLTDIDLVVVPGLGFTKAGQRLGRGGGHFDRFLPTVPENAVILGLAFHQQLLGTVPVEPHDQAVHAVITEQGQHRGKIVS